MTDSPLTLEEELSAAVPPSARERLARMQASGQWSSQVSTGAQAALSGVGFSPVGQVMGASVWSLNQTGRGACGGYGYSDYGQSRYSSGYGFTSSGGYGDPQMHPAAHVGKLRTPYMQTLGPLVHTYTRARRSALRRLQGEAAALGADGVIGVQLVVEPFAGSAQRSLSFIALGTAIRSRGKTHLAGPFLSDLNGSDLALLLRAGWTPTGLVMGVGAVVAHDSWRTVQRRRTWSGNVEIAGFSDLATQARADARVRLNEDVRLHSGQAAVLGNVSVSVWEQRCTKNSAGGADADHLVEAVMLGTALARFDVPAATSPPEALPMIRLSGRRTPGRPATATVTDPFTVHRGS